MEKQTRVNKYKDLREEMKEEVAINRQVKTVIGDEEDDFLAFMPKKEEKKLEDTLLEPLTYETLDHDNESVQDAINKAKVNVGKEQFNTRLDILSRIRKEEKENAAHVVEYEQEQTIVEEQPQPQKKMSLLEKLAAMSPEEDVEELERYEQELTVEELMRQEKKAKKVKKEKKYIRRPVVEEEKVVEKKKVKKYNPPVEEEEESKLVVILNYAIIAFMIIFIVLVFLIVKQMFF